MEIKEQGILEFKALTLSSKLFKQLRQVRGSPDVKFIGWVNDAGLQFFLGILGNKIVCVRRTEMWDYFITQPDDLEAEAKQLGLSVTMLINVKLDELRDKLPQVFLK